MEKKMEITISYWGLYRDYIGTMESEIETTIM